MRCGRPGGSALGRRQPVDGRRRAVDSCRHAMACFCPAPSGRNAQDCARDEDAAAAEYKALSKKAREGSGRKLSSRSTKRPPVSGKVRASGQRRRKPEPEAMSSVGSLAAMADRIVELQKTARGLGIFVDDRELLACSKCGLMEDVLFDGRLVTCHKAGGTDTRLRFTEQPRAGGRFICPECGTVLPSRLRS